MLSADNVLYARVVELCLAAAAKRDPSNLALHFYKNGENPDDSAGMAAFHARSACYSQVFNLIPCPGTFCILLPHLLGDEHALHPAICLFPCSNLPLSTSCARASTSGFVCSHDIKFCW